MIRKKIIQTDHDINPIFFKTEEFKRQSLQHFIPSNRSGIFIPCFDHTVFIRQMICHRFKYLLIKSFPVLINIKKPLCCPVRSMTVVLITLQIDRHTVPFIPVDILSGGFH